MYMCVHNTDTVINHDTHSDMRGKMTPVYILSIHGLAL